MNCYTQCSFLVKNLGLAFEPHQKTFCENCSLQNVQSVGNNHFSLQNLAFQKASKALFTRDRIQMGSDPFGSDPLFERRLHGFGSRTVRVYTGSDPFGFYGFPAAL